MPLAADVNRGRVLVDAVRYSERNLFLSNILLVKYSLWC
jgi:hypothetical protein